MKKKSLGLMIFRQDLRTTDNTALRHAVQECEQIIPLFIFDDRVLSSFPADDKRLGFLREALEVLEEEIAQLGGTLYVEHGDPVQIIQHLVQSYDISTIYRNKSYGNGSENRDIAVKNLYRHVSGQEKKTVKSKHVTIQEYSDYLLLDEHDVEQRKVFTPFFRKRLIKLGEKQEQGGLEPLIVSKISTPHHTSPIHISLPRLADQTHITTYRFHPHRSVRGVREQLLSCTLTEYDTTRNLPADTDGTTKISPYLAFGILSAKEVFTHFLQYADICTPGNDIYRKEKNRADVIISELAWREFWQHIAFYFPETTTDTLLEFQVKRKTIKRENNKERFERRKNGTTGYPIVDAGMRQLRETNRMHNRVRMVVASFLTKDLLIDRRRGEEHFKNYLIDYDRNVNIGNRQRSASVGADPKPLRIFNPILQSQRYDPLATYILRRIPELAGQPIKPMHDPIKYVLDYTPPVVDHYVWSKEAKKRYNESRDRYLSQPLLAGEEHESS